MYFSPMMQLQNYVSNTDHALALNRIYMEEMTAIHFGQAWDIHWHREIKKLPSQAQYYQMVENKTSVLPRMTLRFLGELTNQDEETKVKLIHFVNLMGAAFQIMDDVLAVEGDAFKKMRGQGDYCEDIAEGKKTLMVLHSYYYGWKGDRLLDILAMKTKDEVMHREAV